MFQFYLSSIKSSSQEFKFRYCNSFNSTLVQLKGPMTEAVTVVERSFNSTLVQLKAALEELNSFEERGFNSTLVQLKVSDVDYDHMVETRFNSTLVQLKGRYSFSRTSNIDRFQFYLSSIKRHS